MRSRAPDVDDSPMSGLFPASRLTVVVHAERSMQCDTKHERDKPGVKRA